MIYYHLPISLALGIVSLGLIAADGLTIESKSRHLNFAEVNIVPLVVAQSEAETDSSKLKPTPEDYESYMKAGYEAETSGNYQQAVEYYQKALELRPQNSQLKNLLRNVTGYAFDSYMQAGYVADRRRNYREALNNFRKALKLKPDSFHAQQAIRNITNYLILESDKSTLAQVNSDRSSPPSTDSQTDKWIESNKIWFLLGMGVASILSGLILINLFRSEPRKAKKQSEFTFPDRETLSSQDFPHEVIASNHESPIEPKTTNPTTTPPVTPEVIADHLPLAKKHQQLKPKTSPIKPEPVVALQRMTQAFEETSEVPSNAALSSSDSVNQVSILASKTTKIDLVLELIKDLRQGDRNVRRKAIWELAQKSDSRGIAPLIEMMPKVDSLERNLILEAVTQITSRTLQPMNRILLESLEDENAQVRKNAIRDLTRLYQLMSQVTKRLSQMTKDSDLEVQQTARWALQQLDRLPATKQALKQEQKHN